MWLINRQCFYVTQILYYGTMFPVKLSILALYSRIFTFKAFRFTNWVTTFICSAWFIGALIPTIVQCNPISYTWHKAENGSCLNQNALYLGTTFSNLFTDIIILFLPIWPVATLRLSIKQRLAVSSIFLLGGAAVLCSMARVISQWRFEDDLGGTQLLLILLT